MSGCHGDFTTITVLTRKSSTFRVPMGSMEDTEGKDMEGSAHRQTAKHNSIDTCNNFFMIFSFMIFSFMIFFFIPL